MTIRRKNSEDNDQVQLDDGLATLRVREVDNAAVISRRGVLWRAGLATAAGAAALSALDEQRAAAATNGSFLLGIANDASSATTLQATPGLTVGFSQLMALDGSSNVTVSALDVKGPSAGTAVYAHVDSGVGASGSSTSGIGTAGSSTSGTGASGSSASGTGVSGSSSSGIGVKATSVTGTALRVSGKVHFSRAGSSSVAHNSTSKTVTVSGMTASSLVLATLQVSVTGLYITGVVPASGKFTLHLNKAAPKSMKFAWFVLSG